MSTTIHESAINIIAEGTRLDGKIIFQHVTRVHGVLIGEVHSQDGSTLILGETSLVEGNIHSDTLIIDGYVQGDIFSKTKVVVSRTGRVIGNIHTKSLQLEFGAYFEGKCAMEEEIPTAARALKPA